MDNREAAELAAAAWIARRERGEWNDDQQAELTAWIEASLDNRVAWLRTQAAWDQTKRLQSLSTSAAPGNVPTREQLRVPFFGAADSGALPAARERRQAGMRSRVLAAAASLLLALALVAAWYIVPRGPAYETSLGALQTVPLADGSRITLNSDTRLTVELTKTERRINLTRGEAFFEVAKDASRPFVVRAGDRRVIAVGTQFSVRRQDDEIRVLVSEGSVRVEQSTAPAASAAVQLGAGSVARAGSSGVLVHDEPMAEVEQRLSWRTGYLSFDRTPLAEAAAEFNRYSSRKIVIEDPSVAAIRIGGNFRSTNVEAFVRLIESDFPIRATEQGDRIVLSGAPPH
ncbi:MAG: FecR domain-containing protein [Gammaproteobacteria bacterium]